MGVLRRTMGIALLIGAGALGGCAAHVHTPLVPGDQPARAWRIGQSGSEFAYVDHLPAPPFAFAAEDDTHWIGSLAFPSFGENGQDGNLVTARYYKGKGPTAKPLVIVLPIWGVHDYPPKTMVASLRRHSGGAINVLEIIGEDPLFDLDAIGRAESEAEFFALLERMIDRFVGTVIDIRRVVDWAHTQPDVDPDRIAVIGFSMSALVASVAIANEPRLAAGVLVMGGADLHEILAACGREVGDARERVMERLDWSLDEFRRELGRALTTINPARFAGLVDPRRVLIIEAAKDTCMPWSTRERLWHAMGRPERVAYAYDHRMSFLAMTFLGGNDLQEQALRFLDGRLSLMHPAPPDRVRLADPGPRAVRRRGSAGRQLG